MLGVETDIDDILIWDRAKEEHDQHLKMALKRCGDIGLTLNKDKCVIGTSLVAYIGHILTADGVKPDESKVKAVLEMPAPTDKKESCDFWELSIIWQNLCQTCHKLLSLSVHC